MKNQVAASAVAIASLAREGFTPPGDLVFVAAADEEVGENYGLQWLCEHHPHAVRVDYAINEGGGERVELGGRAFYLCATAEKMSSPFRLACTAAAATRRCRDRRQRARQGGAADRELGAYGPSRDRPEVAASSTSCSASAAAEQALERCARVDPLAAETIEPLLSFTLSPTMIAPRKRERDPGVCESTSTAGSCPARRPRTSSRSSARSSATAYYELETIERFGGTRSPLDTPLWDAISAWSSERAGRDAGAALLRRLHRLALAPRGVRHRRLRLLPAADDGRRAGARLIHSADERTHVDDLELGVEFLRAAAPLAG
jgi:hypothetical protein